MFWAINETEAKIVNEISNNSLPLVDHKKEMITMTNFPIPGRKERIIRIKIAATAAGKEQ